MKLLKSHLGIEFLHCSWEDVTESTPMTVHIDENETKGDGGNNLNNTTALQQQQQQQQHNGRSVAIEELDGCVQFTSIVSASFMLVHCPNWMSCDLISLVDQMHKVSPSNSRIHFYWQF